MGNKVKLLMALAVVIVLLLAGAGSALAQEVPPIPADYSGDVYVGGAKEAGLEVWAEIEDYTSDSVTTNADGYYFFLVVGPPDAAYVGKTIHFYVNGVETNETSTFASGSSHEDFTLHIAALPPSGGGGRGGGGGTPDTIVPTISGISASSISETTADIRWRTNEASTTQVEYWTSPSKLSPLDETMVYNHLVRLTDLTPGTTYHYKTMSKDAAGNLAVSDEDTFATLEAPVGEAPAAIFTSSDLSISPTEVNIGEEVTISVSVTNTGNAAGSYKVTVKIDGVVEATKEVTLDAAASKDVTFTTSKDKAATYLVAVNGLSGSFTVKEKVAPAPAPAPPPAPPSVKAPINWPLIGGIIGGVIVVGLLVFFLVVRRRAY